MNVFSVCRRDERGAVLAELAIVLPLLIMLFAGLAEFGRYFYEYTTLAKATRNGARYLMTAPADGSDDANAKNLVIYGNQTGTGSPVITGLTSANVTITRAGVAQTVTVQITGYKHQPLFDLGKLINSPSLSLNVDVKPGVTVRWMPSI